jgi:hypothetical protein
MRSEIPELLVDRARLIFYGAVVFGEEVASEFVGGLDGVEVACGGLVEGAGSMMTVLVDVAVRAMPSVGCRCRIMLMGGSRQAVRAKKDPAKLAGLLR